VEVNCIIYSVLSAELSVLFLANQKKEFSAAELTAGNKIYYFTAINGKAASSNCQDPSAPSFP
jgi:hypothetical protein